MAEKSCFFKPIIGEMVFSLTPFIKIGFFFSPHFQENVFYLNPSLPMWCCFHTHLVFFLTPFPPNGFLWAQSATTGFYIPGAMVFVVAPFSNWWFFIKSHSYKIVFFLTPNGFFVYPIPLGSNVQEQSEVSSACVPCVCECELVALRLRLARRLSASLVCLRVYSFCRYFC